MKQLMSIVSINPLSPNQVMQGSSSGKATRLGMVSGLGNLIQFPQVTSDITTKILGPLGYQVSHANMAEAGGPN